MTTQTVLLNDAASISNAAVYSIAFRYANGDGPVHTDNKCAIRTLLVDGREIGPIVLPQRGKDAWSNWGESNDLRLAVHGKAT